MKRLIDQTFILHVAAIVLQIMYFLSKEDPIWKYYKYKV